MPKTKSRSNRPPMLFIGWGREGAKDVYSARDAFPYDVGLDCVDAEGVREQEVLQEIANWLHDNPNAQFLFIGSHGNKNGLSPIANRDSFTPHISWRALHAVLKNAETPITVWLGACSSTFAAECWNDPPGFPVNPILGFSGETTTCEVTEFLKALVRRNSFPATEPTQDAGNFSYLPEDIVELLKQFPRITMHYRAEEYGYVDYSRFREITGVEFEEYLDRNSHNREATRFFTDVIGGLLLGPAKNPKRKKMRRPSRKRLVVRKLKKSKRRRKVGS